MNDLQWFYTTEEQVERAGHIMSRLRLDPGSQWPGTVNYDMQAYRRDVYETNFCTWCGTNADYFPKVFPKCQQCPPFDIWVCNDCCESVLKRDEETGRYHFE